MSGGSQYGRCFRRNALATVVLVCAAAAFGGCSVGGWGDDVVTGSGNPVTRSFDVPAFGDVDVSHAFAVDLRYADRFAVSVTVDDNILEHVVAKTAGGTLRVGLDSETSTRNATLRARIEAPAFSSLSASGASRIAIEGFPRLQSVRLNASGGSAITGQLDAAELAAEIAAASSVALTGSSARVDLQGSGASRYELDGLVAETARIRLSGGASAEITVTGSLEEVSLTSGSRLRYAGHPTVGRTHVAGGSSMGAR